MLNNTQNANRALGAFWLQMVYVGLGLILAILVYFGIIGVSPFAVLAFAAVVKKPAKGKGKGKDAKGKDKGEEKSTMAPIPTKLVGEIGKSFKVDGKTAIVTHQGGIFARENWSAPKLLAVKIIVKLMKEGKRVFAANTCRQLTLKKYEPRARKHGDREKLCIVADPKA